jgi:hypothetical protein
MAKAARRLRAARSNAGKNLPNKRIAHQAQWHRKAISMKCESSVMANEMASYGVKAWQYVAHRRKSAGAT